MSSITDKLKKRAKHLLKKFVPNSKKPQLPWEKDPEMLDRVDNLFDQIMEIGAEAVMRRIKREDIDKEALQNMPAFEANLTTKRNRSIYVGCLEATRVPLTKGEVDYINANYVSTPMTKNKFITTQAPLAKTCLDFWNMVVEQGSEIIIGLTPLDLIDDPIWVRGKVLAKAVNHTNLCANYFPVDGRTYAFGEEDEDSEVTVAPVDIIEHVYDLNGRKIQVVERVLEIEHFHEQKKKKKIHVVRHFQWVWNEPLGREWNCLPMQFMQDLPKTDKPIVVQCTTGSHISAAFVMCQYYLELLELRRDILRPSEYLKEMRAQRHNFFSHSMVYLYFHMVLLHYFIMKTGKTHPKLGKFKMDYEDYFKNYNLVEGWGFEVGTGEPSDASWQDASCQF